MTTTIRTLAGALIVGSALRAILSVLLTWALALASPTLGLSAFDSRVFAYVLPFVVAVGVWIVAPSWASWIETLVPRMASYPAVSARAAYVLIGTAMVVVPLLTLGASWAVIALRMAIARSWFEGGMLLEPGYYSLLVTTYGPEILAGAVLLALARHLAEQ